MTAADRTRRTVDVLVVGAGPAGLAAATRLAAAGVGRVEVLDREQQRRRHPPPLPPRRIRTARSAPRAQRTGLRPPPRRRRAARRGRPAHRRHRHRMGRTAHRGHSPAPTGLERDHRHGPSSSPPAPANARAAHGWCPAPGPRASTPPGELQQAVHLHGPAHRHAGRSSSAPNRSATPPSTPSAAPGSRSLPWSPACPATRPTRRAASAPGCATAFRCSPATTVTGLTGHGRLTGVRVRPPGRPDRDPRLRHRGVHRRLRSPTTNWPARAGIPLDPGTRGPETTPRSAPANPGSSPWAICCTRWRRRPPPRWTAGAPPLPCCAIWPVRRGRGPRCRSGPTHPCAGWRPAGSPRTARPRRPAASSCAPPRSSPGPCSWSARTAVRCTGSASARTVAPGRPLRLSADWIARADARGGPVRIGVE